MTQQRTFPENVSQPTPERDELAAILHAGIGNSIGETVNDILLAGFRKPRTITTAAEYLAEEQP